MSRDVTHVEHAGEYRLILTFEGGERREIDITQIVTFTGVFEPLRAPEFFRRVEVNRELGTIVWPNGADIAPETLFEESRPIVLDRAG